MLRPVRSDAGYRLYSDRDLERLEQITALKFLGLPLKQIASVLDHPPLELPDALRLQRRVLEEKQRNLATAIAAIRQSEATIDSDPASVVIVLQHLIAVLSMEHEGIDVMKRYYPNEQVWSAQRGFYERWPSPEWRLLYRDIQASRDEDPGGERGRTLAIRWMSLVDGETAGRPEARWGWILAWNDRHYWPTILRVRAGEFQLDLIWRFIGKSFVELRKQTYSDADWAGHVGLSPAGISQSWYTVLLKLAGALGEDPDSEGIQSLVARLWEADPGGEGQQILIAGWTHLASQTATGDQAVLRQIALFTLEQLWTFIARASYASLARK